MAWLWGDVDLATSDEAFVKAENEYEDGEGGNK